MKARKLLLFFIAGCVLVSGCRRPEKPLYTIGYLQLLESMTNSDVRRGFIEALQDGGLKDGINVRLKILNALGDISQVQRIAQDFVTENVDMIVAVSTPGLQAALIATQKIPIVFTSVANPYLTRAGVSPTAHLANVTGVMSDSAVPIRRMLSFIREVLPRAKRIGTLWTPSERNSEYYLELARAAAEELDVEIVAVPVTNSNEVLLAAQVLVNKKIDVIYQISDNTINASFEAIGQVAEENGLPLFGGFPMSTQVGACAAMGWDFYDMGYRSGQVAIRVKNGENPAGIPFQGMTSVKLHLNLKAAEKQGVKLSSEILQRASDIIVPGEK
ncbi:MAG: ABC transporter substrate-binding protein [Candidatus Aminicenantes bacterium]|nr:ABC transporter substrate-binding protein [Candidatus Aminicenantes bacterium]